LNRYSFAVQSSSSTLQRDIFSAYLVTGSRVLAWVVVAAVVYRVEKSAFAVLALVQSTAGVLEYTALGLGPAIIHQSANAIKRARAALGLEATDQELREPVLTVYANGFAMALLCASVATFLLTGFLIIFYHWYLPHTAAEALTVDGKLNLVAFDLILYVGLATICRMMSDAPGAALQTSHRIFDDNILLTCAEWIWAIGTVIGLWGFHLPWQAATGISLFCGSALLLIGRSILSHKFGSGVFDHWWKRVSGSTLRHLLFYGFMVVAAQMADYLYAPTNYILIAKLISKVVVGDYAPAVQIDGGVLLLVTAVATTLLPRTALAHAAGNAAAVRRYYVRGTLATAGLLLLAAPIVWLAAPLMFRLWLGNPLPATCAILPFMLIHTVIGGSSAVGRSILLAIGRVRPFTISVLVAGVCNVILGIVFVKYFHWGLRGIVLGTVIAVVGRCLIWLPWFTLKAIREAEMQTETDEIVESMPPTTVH
jgi:O-antigen/teichoic acid export membrane protein